LNISNNNNNNQFEIPLKLSKALEDSGIIHRFVIDPNNKYVKLRLNSKYNPVISLDVSTEIIIKEKDGWTKFTNKFRDGLKPYKIDKDHENWIVSDVNNNGELIRSIARSNNNNNNTTASSQQQQEQEQQNDLSVESDPTKIEQEKIIEKLSISQVIRRNSGTYATTGTITGVTMLSKMISKISTYCEKCGVMDEVIFNPIPVSNIKSIKENCKSCGKHIQFYNIKPLDHKNTVVIELQDPESFNDLDRLSVFLFDRDTIDIVIGENVQVIGEIRILEKGFIYSPFFYSQSIKYLNRENFVLTESDIKKIEEFNKIYKDKEGGVIKALVERLDPSIIECEPEKEGILYSATNTSNKIGKKSEHLDILLIGPPGLAKTRLLIRATQIVPGSNKVGGQYATGKSLTAIVEKTENSTTLRVGSIVRSRNALCGINELAKMSNDDLAKLYDIMEERVFNFDKGGIKKDIHAPTAIIASSNPANSDSWKSNEKVDFDELPMVAPLKDRFDFIFIFNKRTKEQNDEFADKWSEIQAKEEKGELPDYTEFIVKYIQYAKTFEPIISDEARFLLKEFYKNVYATGFGSPRINRTLNNLAKAIARLKLKNVVDEDDAKKAREFYNMILTKFQKSVVYSESIKIIAYKKGVEIVKRFENFGISLEDLFETICKENKQISTYFGYDTGNTLEIKYNHKTRIVKELLLNNSHIKKIKDNPIVLKWDDQQQPTIEEQQEQLIEGDKGDMEKQAYQEKNEKNNEKKLIFDEGDQKSMSPLSPSSGNNGSIDTESECEKGFQMSPKGRIYRVSEERYRELIGEGEELN
jgi:DNA replicative helicase MCM subunit Mcm2 (Cdc46/Mcm family)